MPAEPEGKIPTGDADADRRHDHQAVCERGRVRGDLLDLLHAVRCDRIQADQRPHCGNGHRRQGKSFRRRSDRLPDRRSDLQQNQTAIVADFCGLFVSFSLSPNFVYSTETASGMVKVVLGNE